MSDTQVKTPVWFWILAVIAVLWNAMGAWDYSATQLRLEWYLSGFTEEQLAYFFGFPAWYEALWATAVWTAFLGSIALLLRRKFASILFLVSIICFIASAIYSFGFTPAIEMMGIGGAIFSAIIFLSLLGFFWMARWASSAGIMK